MINTQKHTSFEEFQKMYKESFPRFLPEEYRDVDIEDIVVNKPNGQNLHGVSIGPKGSASGMVVYLDGLHKAYREGALLVQMLAMKAYEYVKLQKSNITPDVSFLNNPTLDTIRNKLGLRLYNKPECRDYLADKAYMEVAPGLVLVVDIKIKEQEHGVEYATVVTNELLALLDCDMDTLVKAASVNAADKRPAFLSVLEDNPYRDNLLRYNSIQNPEESMYLLKSDDAYGASALFYPGILDKIAALLKSGFYICPNKMDEVLICPDNYIDEDTGKALDASGIENLRFSSFMMCMTLPDEQRLTDDILHYEMGGKLSKA